jgi:antiviral helicase SLH1
LEKVSKVFKHTGVAGKTIGSFSVCKTPTTTSMAPAALDSAEAQWQAQLAAMKAALAELKLPEKTTHGEVDSYGSDIDFGDEGFTSGNNGEDVWDFISDSEEDLYSGDLNEDLTPESETEGYGPQWLKSKCIGFASRKQGLSGEDLQEQIMALLASDSVEEELQSTLTDIIGFDDLDFVIELISHRKEITAPSPFSTNNDDGIFGKLQTKRQREEALRRRDYEHKHAELGPAQNKDEPQYPHVYKAHSAGNILDSRGRKYGLPLGSERKEHEVSFSLSTS